MLAWSVAVSFEWHGKKFSSYSNKNKAKYKKVRVLPINESTLLKTLDLVFHLSAVHQAFYISICISTLPIRSTINFMFLSDEGPTFQTLDFTFYIGSTSTFFYFDFFLNTAYTQHTILVLEPYLITIHAISSGDLFSYLRHCLYRVYKKDGFLQSNVNVKTNMAVMCLCLYSVQSLSFQLCNDGLFIKFRIIIGEQC